MILLKVIHDDFLINLNRPAMKDNTIPNMTSAEALSQYPAGQKIIDCQGEEWKNIKVSLFSLTGDQAHFDMPAITEPFLVWIMSGEAETREREDSNKEWHRIQVKAGSFYLTGAGAPYEFAWKRLSPEPFEVMMVVLSLNVFSNALTSLYGEKADSASILDQSGFEDDALLSLLKVLKTEAYLPSANALLINGVAQSIAVHLARNYVSVSQNNRTHGSHLPAYKLKRVIQWMQDHLIEEFSLRVLAEQADMSEFHFNRLFKQSTGMPPSQFHIKLRLDLAKRLLRETQNSIISIANDVGYSNPSHFAQLIKRETGMTPREYRRHR